MYALIPLASVLAPLHTLVEAAPDLIFTWAPVALAVLLGVGLVGTIAAVALAVVLAKSRKSARAAA